MNGQNSQIPPGMLQRIIWSKREIIAHYNALAQLAPDRMGADIIAGIRSDETAHLNMFNTLYINLFGEAPPDGDIPEPVIGTYFDGVKDAVLAELDEYSYYGAILLSDSGTDVRRTFAQAMFDENRHASSLNFLLAQGAVR